MTIAPRFHIEHVKTLAHQIKRAPLSVRLSQLQAAEKLSQEIVEETLYPLDYVVYRITKYRGDGVNQPMLLGSALIGDLVAMVAIISRTLDLPAVGMLTIDETANKLGVSSRTISRLRNEGLLFRWVVESSGKRRLGCDEQMLKTFKDAHHKRIEHASRFSRLSSQEQGAIVTAALHYWGSGRSLSDVAAALSITTGRGHETIRSLLASSSETMQKLGKPPPLSRKDARVIERAIGFGIPWRPLVARYQRTAGTLRKVVARLRATRLKQMEITYVALDVFARDDAEEIILGAPAVLQVKPIVLQLDPFALGMNHGKSSEAEETAIVSAMHLLRRRARLQSKPLGYTPSEEVLDRIETDLRWSFLLQQHLVLMALPSAIAVGVQHAGRSLRDLPASRTISLMKVVIRTVGAVCGSLDPSKGQTTQRTPASVLDRYLSTSNTSHLVDRAAARHQLPLFECPFHDIVPWSMLIPRQDLPQIAKATSTELAALLSLRFGWSGYPRTVGEIANEMNRNTIWVARQLRTW